MARRQQENDESKIKAGLPSPVAILWGLDAALAQGASVRDAQAEAAEARAAPRAGHSVPCFALENAQRRSELLARLYCPLPPLEETRQDLLTQARAREAGGGRDLWKLWCLFNNNLHGTRSLCSKRRGSYYWLREEANVLVRLLCKLNVSANNYAQHKSRAAQWQFLRRAYLERGDLLWVRLLLRGCSLQQPCVPLFLDALTLERHRTRLHLRLYRHSYAEQDFMQSHNPRFLMAKVTIMVFDASACSTNCRFHQKYRWDFGEFQGKKGICNGSSIRFSFYLNPYFLMKPVENSTQQTSVDSFPCTFRKRCSSIYFMNGNASTGHRYVVEHKTLEEKALQKNEREFESSAFEIQKS
eukprot:g50097.t1